MAGKKERTYVSIVIRTGFGMKIPLAFVASNLKHWPCRLHAESIAIVDYASVNTIVCNLTSNLNAVAN
jgi:hypothetical protein